MGKKEETGNGRKRARKWKKGKAKMGKFVICRSSIITVLSGLEVHPENWYTLKKSTPYLTKKSALKVSTPPKISTLQLGIVKAHVIILLQCAL